MRQVSIDIERIEKESNKHSIDINHTNTNKNTSASTEFIGFFASLFIEALAKSFFEHLEKQAEKEIKPINYGNKNEKEKIGKEF